MRMVIQRVQQSSVTIDGNKYSEIGRGLLILVGIESADTQEDIDWLCNKCSMMRIFEDEQGLMNKSVQDIDGEIMIVSQFTLFASTKKGNRPSFIRAAKPDTAIPLYQSVCQTMSKLINKEVKTGVFGADMKINLTNDGPVTICIDSKNRE
ncbi:MAG: D-aminoacyl-tRNA deacylase [Bacteroides sp.]|nr:D-aminoacyl-tRNA deacylase [Bacteroides sp.]